MRNEGTTDRRTRRRVGLGWSCCLLWLGLLVGCQAADDPPAPPPGFRIEPTTTLTGLDLSHPAFPGVRLAGLSPAVRVRGQEQRCGAYPRHELEQLSAGSRAEERTEGAGWRLSCRGAEAFPDLALEVRQLPDGGLTLRAWAVGPVDGLEGIVIEPDPEGVRLEPGPIGFLSNGFQSWSSSGPLRLPEVPPTTTELTERLTARGAAEVDRDGRFLSWWFTALAAQPGPALVVGSSTADRWPPSIAAWGPSGRITLRLQSGLTGEQLTAGPDELVHGEAFLLYLGEEVWTVLRGYAARLGRGAGSLPPRAPRGWNSWCAYWDKVSAEQIETHRAATATLFGTPSDGEVQLVIDDGWERSWGDWTPNDRFPGGMAPLAEQLTAQGLRPGLWLAPLLVERNAPLAAAHPDWFVRDPTAPDRALLFKQPLGGTYQILDVTRPEAAAHLTSLLEQVVGWGYTSLKLDFLFAGAWTGLRHAPVTGLEAYNRALTLLREGMGDTTWWLACGAPLLAARAPGPDRVLPYQAIRTGTDIAFDFAGMSWSFVLQQLRNTAARSFLQGLVVTVDPDPALLRAPFTETEAWTMLVSVLVSGGQLFSSDPLPELPDARRQLLAHPAVDQIRSLGGPARPVGLLDPLATPLPERFPSGTEDYLVTETQGGNSQITPPAVWVWPTCPDSHDLTATNVCATVALFRFPNSPGSASVPLTVLGLDPAAFWRAEPLGPGPRPHLAQGRLTVDLAGHQALLVVLRR